MIANKYVSFVIHGVGFAHHVFAIQYILNHIEFHKSADRRVVEIETFTPRYITTWNLLIQTVYLFISLCVDYADIKPPSKPRAAFTDLVKKYRGYLYTVLMFPTTLFVAFGFWTMFWINREWVLPESVDEVSPRWVNHSIHSVILLVLFAELFLTKKGLPKPSFNAAVKVLSVFGFIYLMQFLYTYYQMGRWIYGIYYDLTWPQRIFFMVTFHMISIGFLKLGFIIQSYKDGKTKIF